MTLADLSAWIRASLKWVAAGIGIIILLWIAWIVIVGLSSSIFKPRGADTQFGVIDPPLFVKTHAVFKAENLDNEAESPNSQEKVNVYKFTSNSQITEDLQKDLVSFFRLTSAEKTEDQGLITLKRKTGNTSLKIDTNSSHFTFRKSIQERFVNSKINLNESAALDLAKEAFGDLGLKLENADINTETPSVTYLSITPTSRSLADAESANAVELGFFRNINDTLTTGEAPIRIVYANGGREILEFDFHFSPIDETGAPYPIISATEALELLQNGGGYTDIDQQFESAKITSITLSYWESQFFQAYLQPIWKFTGEGVVGETETTFQTYVPAVNTTYLDVPQEEEPPTPDPSADQE